MKHERIQRHSHLFRKDKTNSSTGRLKQPWEQPAAPTNDPPVIKMVRPHWNFVNVPVGEREPPAMQSQSPLAQSIQRSAAAAIHHDDRIAFQQGKQIDASASTQTSPGQMTQPPSIVHLSDAPIQRAAEKKGKKKKGKGVPLGQWLAENPSKPSPKPKPAMNFLAAASAPASAPALAPPPEALGPVEVSDVGAGEVTNKFIGERIASMAGYTVESIAHTYTTKDTVYYDVCILGPVTHPEGALNPQQNRYTLKLHYHPNPDTPNWLHLKRTEGGSPGNTIDPKNAILTGYTDALRAGQADWESAHNGDSPAPQRLVP